MNGFFKFACLIGVLLTPACASLGIGSAGSDSDSSVQQYALSLEGEVARLEAENEQLSTELKTLRRERAAAAPAASPADLTVESESENVVSSTLRDETEAAPRKPQPSIVVDAAKAPEIAQTETPVAEQPRLVQPTFASADSVFENEAEDGFDLESVLFGVHLASYRASEQAREGWNKLQRENPDELGLLEPRVESISVAGKGSFLRLIGGGFASQEKAHELCAKLKDKGLFCDVVSFDGAPLSLQVADRLR